MQPLHIGRDFKKEFEYHGRAMKMIMDSLKKEQTKDEEEKPIICDWCGSEIDDLSVEQKLLLEDFELPCCLGCYKEGQQAVADMWSDLQAQQSL